MKPKILVISLGNPLRGDDTTGSLVIKTLEKTLPTSLNQYVTLETAHQIDVTHTTSIKDYKVVIFVDVDARIEEGIAEVRKLAPKNSTPGFTSHISSIPNLLYLTERIFGSSPECYLVALACRDFAFNSTVSNETDVIAKKGANTVRELIEELFPII
ncbi:hydrogenase maturation protease [Metallumcola ferriviriculae]|uniref:Hydrogenase maturation protease n=1 Tax=Metallumcola ferriviriculae TaxID=3039180 RepID=A0AAU0UPJ9_9FIRM|nr:hydrogenase maturation protease [Desulfitibacteraceae bacterium MK1]